MRGRRSAPGHRFDVHRPERLNGYRPLRRAQPGFPRFARRRRLMLQDYCFANDGQPPPERAHVESMLPAIALPRKTATTPRLDVDRPPCPPSCVLEMFRTHRRSSNARRNPIWTANAPPIRCARTGRLPLAGFVARSAIGCADHGRQDKSAASGRAHVVGWIGVLGRSANPTCWRFRPKRERSQSPERHPSNRRKHSRP